MLAAPSDTMWRSMQVFQRVAVQARSSMLQHDSKLHVKAAGRSTLISRHAGSAAAAGSTGPQHAATIPDRQTNSKAGPGMQQLLQPQQPGAHGMKGKAASVQSRAATMQQNTLMLEDQEQHPMHVPRNPGISDGAWSPADSAILRASQQDAQAAVTSTAIDAKGFVLLGKTLQELEELAKQMGQPAYRGKQLLDAVLKGARDIADISTIPKDWRQQLKASGVRTGRSILHHSVTAQDGTRKFLLQLADGRVVETVGIPLDDQDQHRLTVCVSSQVGCPMRCTFCATGKGGFARNLMPHEILDQFMTVQEIFGRRVSNVVFMGMGEPLLNLPSVVKACKLINEQLGLGARYITISTVGVPNAIVRLAQQDVKATLAVSIHAPNQALRETIIPSAKAYPLEALMMDCVRYYKRTGRRVTFEYTLLSGVNDLDEHAAELAALLRRHNLMSHVNLIPWNTVDESEFKRPSKNRVFAFQRVLESKGLPATIRVTRGLEAAAACGQLRNQYQKVPLEQFSVPT